MSDRFDELLNKALHDESAVEPLAGLEARVMARVRETSAPASRQWMFAAWAGGVGLAAAVVVLVVLLPGRHEVRAVRNDGLAAGVMPSGAKAPSALMTSAPLSKIDSRPERGRASRETHLRRDKAAPNMGHTVVVAFDAKPLPKLDMFPSPTRDSEQDRVLAAIVSSPKEQAAFASLKKEQEEPVHVAAIQIPLLSEAQ